MKSERFEKTWVVRKIGTVGPAVTIPAENKTRMEAFHEGVSLLRRDFAEMKDMADTEFECSFNSVEMGPVLEGQNGRRHDR